MLRAFIWILGALFVAGGLVMIGSRAAWPAGLELAILGVVIILSLTVEQHYRGTKARAGANWQPTGEKFIDPGTGKLIEVDYDPKTGERDYRQT